MFLRHRIHSRIHIELVFFLKAVSTKSIFKCLPSQVQGQMVRTLYRFVGLYTRSTSMHLLAMGDQEALDELRDLFTYTDSLGNLRKISYIKDARTPVEQQPAKRSKLRGTRVVSRLTFVV